MMPIMLKRCIRIHYAFSSIGMLLYTSYIVLLDEYIAIAEPVWGYIYQFLSACMIDDYCLPVSQLVISLQFWLEIAIAICNLFLILRKAV
jgi:hypothetical protein